MSSDQNYLEMRVLIQKHKDNERIYKEKISEVNLTRARINDQLELLKQSYDKKIKSLEQKLQNMKLQNETLLRQNLLFKTQIDTYQNRLLEKEKIILVLLNQKRETPLNGNSERSKSDKTQSNHANQEQSKNLKKQVNSLRDSAQEIYSGSHRFKEDQILVTAKVNREFKQSPLKIQNTKEKDVQESPSNMKKKLEAQQPEVQSQPVHRPPPKKSKPQVEQHPINQENLQFSSATNYFQSLSKGKQEQEPEIHQEKSTQVRRIPPPPKKKPTGNKVTHPPGKKEPRKPKIKELVEHIQEQEQTHAPQAQVQSTNYQEITNPYMQQQDIHQDFNQNLVQSQQRQELQYQRQVQYVQPQENYQEYKEFNYAQHFSNTQPVQEQENPNQHKVYQHPQVYAVEQTQAHKEEAEPYNNFLSHFSSQPQNQQEMTGASISPKPIARKKKDTKKPRTYAHEQNLQQDHSINSTDFFNQLNKHEHEVPHQLDIQQSSIDHNDRDSSLISNEQHYFAQQQAVQRAKPVKMTKKKGKRDQIKVADPSLFE